MLERRETCHVYFSPMLNESRIQRMTSTLVDAGVFTHAILIGRSAVGLRNVERNSRKSLVMRLGFQPTTRHTIGRWPWKILHYALWLTSVLLFLLRRQPKSVSAHSWTVLPVCWLATMATKAVLVYEPHELEPHTVAAGRIGSYCARMIEGLLLRSCDRIIVVNDAIRAWYEKKYHLTGIKVIYNFPSLTTQKDTNLRLRELIGISENEVLVVYQGIFSRGRSIPAILNVAAKFPAFHFCFIGSGELGRLITQSHSKGLKNVHLLAPVPSNELLSLSRQADVGLCLIENASLSYYLSSPNKLFEYIGAGLPCVASAFPEISKFLAHRRYGWCINPDERSLAALLASKEFREAVVERRANLALVAQPVYSWESQVSRIVAIYNFKGTRC